MKEKIIKNNVYTLRSERGVTQQDFADAIGVTRQTIIAIEKGNYTPSVLLALQIAQYFKKPVEEIFQITK
ncbi:MAG: helix-turn-helix transcriptional regulator [bacterium]|nr:helix-turn-helix transcriptional regulator [bacterium]